MTSTTINSSSVKPASAAGGWRGAEAVIACMFNESAG
jgi:hypothetical protein